MEILLLLFLPLCYSFDNSEEIEDISNRNLMHNTEIPEESLSGFGGELRLEEGDFVPEKERNAKRRSDPVRSPEQKSPGRKRPLKDTFSYFRNRKPKEEKFQNYELPPDKQRDVGGYSNGGGYGIPARSFTSESVDEEKKENEQQDKQVVAGIPDLSDPCFRRYSNCIIVNAQPYERRSSQTLSKCKRHCLESQLGIYSCRSFVFDNVNQVCDLFAHVGDQAPARLLKFQTRDYFEPTGALQCDLPGEPTKQEDGDKEFEPDKERGGNGSELRDEPTPPLTSPPIWTTSSSSAPPPPPAEEVFSSTQLFGENDSSNFAAARSANTDSRADENLIKPSNVPIGDQCGEGKVNRYLRTVGFELFNNDDITIAVNGVDECVTACSSNSASGRQINCKSFDFSENHCSLTEEAAVPLGNGQLKQKSNSEYYEKICVDEKISKTCPSVFNRFPQMILVGFAESVTDAPSFEQCFHHCLDSFQLYGFNCTSGMYYFEETQLNCILNTEDRHSQSELFAEENTDIVDYFEIGCERNELKKSRSKVHGTKTKTFDTTKLFPKSENLVIAEETSTEWSDCEDGVQHRRRDCANHGRPCGLESRACGEVDRESIFWPSTRTSTSTTPPTRTTIGKKKSNAHIADRLKKAMKAFNCAPDVCCAVFGGCKSGLLQNSRTRKWEWCQNPC